MKTRFQGWIGPVVAAATLSLPAFAIEAAHVPSQMIVKLKPGFSVSALTSRKSLSSIQDVTPLVPELNLYLVKTRAKADLTTALSQVRGLSETEYAQLDHYVSERDLSAPILPNDVQFDRLWSLKNNNGSDISATLAWRYGTGGKDREGNDIVVAVVDGGVDVTHPDLLSNIWVNSGEIAGNGIDDDGNGYVDDVNGWNAYSNNGTTPANSHATHVAGTIGAMGNNKTLIAGINWNVKIMSIAGASGSTSTISIAYGYALKQKKLWLETAGAKGANVVATNSSFGVDNADCRSSSYPVWNDLYNAMGDVGILSAAATANNNVNVDQRGDVPTACASPYIVGVTNTTIQNAKYAQAGYGRTHIDLGAPGTDIISTVPGGNTGAKTGTSMATPHVAGSIAFLHSVASAALADEVKHSPAVAALALKKILIDTVDPIASLKDVTVSGGRLNLNRAAEAAHTYP